MSNPRVMRRIVVPADIRLDRLHLAIQAARGWTNTHLYEFRIGGAGWGEPDPDGIYGPMDAKKARLAAVLADAGRKTFSYVYDFGDGWDHTIKLEKIVPAIEGGPSVLLLEALGRCPPEDCGGPSGYERLLQILADPEDEEHSGTTSREPFAPSFPGKSARSIFKPALKTGPIPGISLADEGRRLGVGVSAPGRVLFGRVGGSVSGRGRPFASCAAGARAFLRARRRRALVERDGPHLMAQSRLEKEAAAGGRRRGRGRPARADALKIARDRRRRQGVWARRAGKAGLIFSGLLLGAVRVGFEGKRRERGREAPVWERELSRGALEREASAARRPGSESSQAEARPPVSP